MGQTDEVPCYASRFPLPGGRPTSPTTITGARLAGRSGTSCTTTSLVKPLDRSFVKEFWMMTPDVFTLIVLRDVKVKTNRVKLVLVTKNLCLL